MSIKVEMVRRVTNITTDDTKYGIAVRVINADGWYCVEAYSYIRPERPSQADLSAIVPFLVFSGGRDVGESIDQCVEIHHILAKMTDRPELFEMIKTCAMSAREVYGYSRTECQVQPLASSQHRYDTTRQDLRAYVANGW